ncbi:MAG TPA: hypothetical protein VFA51_12495 [Candidatus Udaeobacter sp.]|nr:hypothetical protein [Candidatus Udaeobacter sp.]
MKGFGLKSIGRAMSQVTLLTGLSLALLVGGPARGGEKAEEPPGCAKCGKAGAVPMADACTTCRNAWDWGPAYWHWGYSAGAWQVSSAKWPAAPYFQPAQKHLCADCKGAPHS